MKVLACAALTICVFVSIPADAQQGSETGVDFLGIYAPPIFDGGGPPRRRPDVLPLSDPGRQAVADYDPILDNPRIQDDCALESMPRLLWTGNPIELRQGEGDTLIIHYERGNTVRTVFMNSAAAPGDHPNSHLGYSVGRWEGDTLVVTTTHLDFPYWSEFGLPQSDQAIILERFTPSEDGNDLDYSLTVFDPVMFTRPFTVEDNRYWAPGRDIPPYDCVVDWEDQESAP